MSTQAVSSVKPTITSAELLRRLIERDKESRKRALAEVKSPQERAELESRYATEDALQNARGITLPTITE